MLYSTLCILHLVLALAFFPLGTYGRDSSQLADLAAKLANDEESLVKLYQDHQVAREKHDEISELQQLLHDLHEEARKQSLDCEETGCASPKHVVTILSDDQGYSDVGYNDDTFITPTIDTLAGFGITFDRFYVQSTCSPTRASLLTGMYITKTGLQDGAIIPAEARHLNDSLLIAPKFFNDAGYSTNLIGKWHLGQRFVNATPNARGYNYFFGFLSGAVDYYERDIGLLCGTEENSFNTLFSDNCTYINGYDLQENGVPYFEQETYMTTLLANKAVERIHSHDRRKPLLLQFHLNAPHTPLQVNDIFFELCKGVSPGTSESVQPWYRQTLCGMMISVDLSVLRLVLALAGKGMLSSTLIVYHSDNGGYQGAGSVNAPWRGEKGMLYDGGLRVPAFMYGNGLHRSNSILPVRDDLIHVSDILPTILAYAGVKTDTVFDGINEWDLLRIGKPLARQNIPINAASKTIAFFSAFIQVIDGTRWKYLLNPTSLHFVFTSKAGETYVPEGEILINQDEDPGETTNLASDPAYAAILGALRNSTMALRLAGVPSTLTLPPTLNTPPSILGCWLPLDSPYYSTVTCPVPTPVIPMGYFDKHHLGVPTMADVYLDGPLGY